MCTGIELGFLLNNDVMNIARDDIEFWNSESYLDLERRYKRLISTSKNEGYIYEYLVGITLYEQGKVIDAKDYFHLSIKTNEIQILPYYYIAKCHQALGYDKDDLIALKATISKVDCNKFSEHELYALAFCYYFLEEYKDCEDTLNKIRNDGLYFVKYLKAKCIGKIKGSEYEDESKKLLRDALNSLKDPSNSSEHLFEGNILLELKDPKRAIKSYTKSIDKSSTKFDALNNRAISNYLLGKHDESIKDLERIINFDSDFKGLKDNYGFMLLKIRKVQKAKRVYEEILLERTNSFEPYFYYSQVIRYSETKIDGFISFVKNNIDIFKYVDHKDLSFKTESSLDGKLKLMYSFLKEAFVRSMVSEDHIKSHLIKIEMLRIKNLVDDSSKPMDETNNLDEEEDIKNVCFKDDLEDTVNKLVDIVRETRKIFIESEGKKEEFKAFLKPKNISDDDNYLEVLRGWNSYTPILSSNHNSSKGGGYFLNLSGEGIVIDPGFDFIQNMINREHKFDDIDHIIVSHAHNDHTTDLESILTLLHVRNSNIKFINYVEDLEIQDYVELTVVDKYKKKSKIINSDKTCKDKCPILDIVDIHNLSICKGFCPLRDIPNKESIKKDVDKEYYRNSNNIRKTINIYMNKSTFLKYSGILKLSKKSDYKIYILDQNMTFNLNDSVDEKLRVEIVPLYAKHDDLYSEYSAVGISINYGINHNIIYTGDTGYDCKIKKQNSSIKIKNINENRSCLLIAHLGGFKNEEDDIKYNSRSIKPYYPNHLGRLGLLRMNIELTPTLCLISEFGEEFKDNRLNITSSYESVLKIGKSKRIIPSDIGLKVFLDEKSFLINCLAYSYYNEKEYRNVAIDDVVVKETTNSGLIYYSKSAYDSDRRLKKYLNNLE